MRRATRFGCRIVLSLIVVCGAGAAWPSGPHARSELVSFAIAAAPTPASVCPDPWTIVKGLYDANDNGAFAKSLEYFTDNATLAMWAEGINGHRVAQRHLAGKKEIKNALGSPGLRRTTDRPDGLHYREAKIKVSGDRVTFTLEPDRLRQNGRLYSPYRVEVHLDGCLINAMTVIEDVTWL